MLNSLMRPRAATPLLAFAIAMLGSASPTHAQLYRSSVVGTDFDFILSTDPSVFEQLDYVGQSLCEMPDKTRSGPLMAQAFVFAATFGDGTRLRLYLDADFATEQAARDEALRYTPRLGKLPTALRRGVERVVVHHGGEDATAFSDVGLIVLYSANATRRIATHDLEETVFHESVHAAWDGRHAHSAGWLAAQASDGAFVTKYAQENPEGEDLAESALFAYALLHHPERIPEPDASRIRAAIPARIAFVAALLPPGEPIFQPIGSADEPDEPGDAQQPFVADCHLDPRNLATSLGISDILSNALMRGLDQEEDAVFSFLSAAKHEHATAEQLIAAAAARFDLEEAAVKASIEEYLHCNCDHDAASPPTVATIESDSGTARPEREASERPGEAGGGVGLTDLLLFLLLVVNTGILLSLRAHAKAVRALAVPARGYPG